MKYAERVVKRIRYIEGLKELIEDIISEGNIKQIKPEYLAWYNTHYL